MVDPDSINKDARFAEKFRVDIHFKNVCERCTDSAKPISELCKVCQEIMQTDIKDSWNIIHGILDVSYTYLLYFSKKHKRPTHEEGALINFRSTMSDYKKILANAAA